MDSEIMLEALIIRLPEASDYARAEELTHLVNTVYEKAESGIWTGQDTRTHTEEIQHLLSENKLFLAQWEDTLVGCVFVNAYDADTAVIAMLSVDEAHQGKRIGAALMQAAEAWAKEKGYKQVRLELLTPRHWEHPDKEFLKQWYQRLGYAPAYTEPFEKTHPRRVPYLATECDYTVWLKPLES